MYTPEKPAPWILQRIQTQLTYDPATGILTWTAHFFPRFIGRRAGSISTGTNNEKYRRIHFRDRSNGVRRIIKEHHIAWFLMEGGWPPSEIDHRDGDGTNNKWQNLRLANRSQQRGNARATSLCGVKGVTKRKNGKFVALLHVPGRSCYLGIFKTIEEATKAHGDAAKEYYGEFAS
jgi:hypothetical protein